MFCGSYLLKSEPQSVLMLTGEQQTRSPHNAPFRFEVRGNVTLHRKLLLGQWQVIVYSAYSRLNFISEEVKHLHWKKPKVIVFDGIKEQ